MKQHLFKGKKSFKTFFATLISVVLVACAVIQLTLPSHAADTIVSDPTTLDSWKKIIDYDTDNVGRIWTDKSVSTENVILYDESGKTPVFTIPKEESDFLVSYSALSSTSNTIITTYSSQPLNISLVLDTSGSMQNTLISRYDPTYDSNKFDGGYVLVNDQYYRVNYIYNIFTNKYEYQYGGPGLFGTTFTPKENEQDQQSDHLQVYVKTDISKMEALKDAVNIFLDETAKQNEKIEDVNRQHMVSIVDFQSPIGASEATHIQQDWINCTTQNLSDIKKQVSHLDQGGATASDHGLQLAIELFNQSIIKKEERKDAKNIVIFFTDGEPNHGNGFDYHVAKEAIDNARTLKDSGATIYSIGVFEDSKPEDTTNKFNQYMHAISSNYPKAQATANSANRGSITLGERVKDSNFYKAATNTEELNQIFTSISEDMNVGNNFPTEIGKGDGFSKSGFINYTDKLGNYMQVDDFKSLIFADHEYHVDTITDNNDGTFTYVFKGKAPTGGNILWPEGDVSTIQIKVIKGTGIDGDTVEVKIPGGMIPLRQFTVKDVDDHKEMTINEALPIRLFYGVSLRKDEALNALKDPTNKEMLDYISKNNDGKGNVYFYSNQYTMNAEGLGDATSVFEPANSNSFYYFTEDTLLYTDEKCQTAATEYVVGRNYYYKKPYYAYKDQASKEAVLKDEIIRFNASQLVADRKDYGVNKDGQLYILAGSPRLTRLDDTSITKSDNKTGTATEATRSHWDSDVVADPVNIITSLGNNGRLSQPIPGMLKISKNIETKPTGISAPNKDFEFKVNITNAQNEPVTTAFQARLFGSDNKPIGETVLVSSGQTIILKDAQYMIVYGLNADYQYDVQEIHIPTAFTPTKQEISGKIISGQIAEAAFINTYSVQPVTSDTHTMFRYQKDLQGRSWLNTDEFIFVLRGEDSNSPLPKVNDSNTEFIEGNVFKKVIRNGEVSSFGEITFTKPGNYIYSIAEVKPSDSKRIPGITYSSDVYKVNVTVEDQNSDGNLVITKYDIVDVENDIALFTNTYNATSTTVTPSGFKKYIDYSGVRPLEEGMFKFEISTTDQDAPMPKDAITSGNERKSIVSNKLLTGNSRNITFGEITFEQKHVRDEPYMYTIKEIIPDDRQGITYDDKVWTVSVKVADQLNNNTNQNIVTVTPSCTSVGSQQEAKETFYFENSYRSIPIEVDETNDTIGAIGGIKVLTGRDMKQDETYKFTLTPDASTLKAIEAHDIVLGKDESITSLESTVTNAKKGVPTSFNFGSILFKKPGTYSFTMKETDAVDGNGLVVDKTEHQVEIRVSDPMNGQPMTVNITYDGKSEKPTFTNVYTSKLAYEDIGGIEVTKKLTGRELKANEFTFTITA